MSYIHIPNLYKSQNIFLLRECYALEKVHGTSAHLTCKFIPVEMVKIQDDDQLFDEDRFEIDRTSPCNVRIDFFSGGESHERFKALFDQVSLRAAFLKTGYLNLTLYGEAYGGAQQGMSRVYGNTLRFIVFDVRASDVWLSVPEAEQIARVFGLEFVPYVRIPTDLPAIDAERDLPSEVALRRGCGRQKREGVVLRPLVELMLNGERIICKHKHDDFSERATPQKVVDLTKLAVLSTADEIAREWVTPMRLAHVLDKFPNANIRNLAAIIAAMVEDVLREGAGEIVDSREARTAIGKRTEALFKSRLKTSASK